MGILQKIISYSNLFDDWVIVSHKQETTTSLIDSLKNGPDDYVSTDGGSFIVTTTGNIMIGLGWRKQISISAEINNRDVGFFYVKNHPKTMPVF